MKQNERLDYLLSCLIAEGASIRPETVSKSFEQRQQLYRALVNLRPPLPAGREYLRIQDEYLHQELRARGIVSVDDLPVSPENNLLAVWRGDICRLRADAIVNAANSQLLGCFHPCHGCIDNAIHTAAGIQLRQACHEIMAEHDCPEPSGSARITPGFNLPAAHVLHTVGPITNGTASAVDRRTLASCYSSCLRLAGEHGLRTLAFCCIATGEYGFPKENAARIAVRTVRDSLGGGENTLKKVVFNVYTDEDEALYRELLGIA